MSKKRLKKGPKTVLIAIIIIVLCYAVFDCAQYLIMKNIPRKPVESHNEIYYKNKDFGFLTIKSSKDYNKNKVDDQTDILLGAKKYAEINPTYISKYYAGGYPPETEGVCTDLIWYALKEAGYYIKDLMAEDIIERNNDVYKIDVIDSNIDFRRVGNQEKFLKEYAETLESDVYNTENLIYFQPGDIVTFDDSDHIAIISDKRNVKGIPYLIQNSDEEQTEKEEDVILETPMKVTGHYRFTYNDKLESLIYREKKANNN